MAAGISVVTLGVSDLERAVRFYEAGLGFALHSRKGEVAYFDLDRAWLALYERRSLAAYAGVADRGAGFGGVTLSRNLDSPEAVDAAVARAAQAGASVVRPAGEVAWGGYCAWFADPDGHLWEMVYNPRPFID